MVEGELVYSPINDVLPVPIQQVAIIDDNVWLLGAGRFAGPKSRCVKCLDSASNILSMNALWSGVLAMTTPQLKVLQLIEDTLRLQTVPNLLPISIGATLSQRLLVSEDDAEIHLYHEDVWTRFSIEGVETVNALMSSPESDLVWIQSDDFSVVYDRGVVCTLDDEVTGDWLDVDALGRLTVAEDGILYRYSIGQPVAVVGMMSNERLNVSREVFFLPTLEESLTDLSVWVGTEQLEVNESQ